MTKAPDNGHLKELSPEDIMIARNCSVCEIYITPQYTADKDGNQTKNIIYMPAIVFCNIDTSQGQPVKTFAGAVCPARGYGTPAAAVKAAAKLVGEIDRSHKTIITPDNPATPRPEGGRAGAEH